MVVWHPRMREKPVDELTAAKDIIEDLDKVTCLVLEYQKKVIDKDTLLKNIEEPLLLTANARDKIFKGIGEMLKELYKLIENESWVGVIDKIDEIKEFLLEKLGEDDEITD